jgi:hypothetical protein|tara:strand:+ start:181 stop:1278 length:1098 start_codon:yes stop_codon:yes gene_type:complete
MIQKKQKYNPEWWNNVTRLTSTSTQHKVISGILSSLEVDKLYSVADIIRLILQIDNFKTKTLANVPQPPVQYEGGANLIQLEDLFIDMTYQRVLQLLVLTRKIKTRGFDKQVAGFIDVAVRPDGTKVVWDGFRRCIMAGLCGLKFLPHSLTIHSMHLSDKECQKIEARLFQIRNTQEKMKPEDLFRAEVIAEDPIAVKTLTFLKECGLNIVGLNPSGKQLGGIAELRKNFQSWQKNFDNEDIDPDSLNGYDWDKNMWIEASNIIQTIWNGPNDSVVSVLLLRDLAWIKTVMEACDEQYDDDEIIEAIKSWQKDEKKFNQKDITTAGFGRKKLTCYYIAKNILKDTNGLKKKLFSHLEDEENKLIS